MPAAGNCKEINLEISSGNATLNPGTYCKGLKIKGTAHVKLNPGVYILKDGPLKVEGDSTITGQNVGFALKDEKAVFDFEVSTQVSLTAPKSGPMAGLLFFADRTVPKDLKYKIRSKNAERFEGTIYLPRGHLIIDKESRLGQASNWTAIIANKIEIGKGPNVQINSDYASSNIPVPEGIGSSVATFLKN